MAQLTCTIVDGLMPNERIAQVEAANGQIEEVEVSTSNISNNKLLAAVIGNDGAGKVLVELPRESASGRWRIWVKESMIVPAAVGA